MTHATALNIASISIVKGVKIFCIVGITNWIPTFDVIIQNVILESISALVIFLTLFGMERIIKTYKKQP